MNKLAILEGIGKRPFFSFESLCGLTPEQRIGEMHVVIREIQNEILRTSKAQPAEFCSVAG